MTQKISPVEKEAIKQAMNAVDKEDVYFTRFEDLGIELRYTRPFGRLDKKLYRLLDRYGNKNSCPAKFDWNIREKITHELFVAVLGYTEAFGIDLYKDQLVDDIGFAYDKFRDYLDSKLTSKNLLVLVASILKRYGIGSRMFVGTVQVEAIPSDNFTIQISVGDAIIYSVFLSQAELDH